MAVNRNGGGEGNEGMWFWRQRFLRGKRHARLQALSFLPPVKFMGRAACGMEPERYFVTTCDVMATRVALLLGSFVGRRPCPASSSRACFVIASCSTINQSQSNLSSLRRRSEQ
jgi:hypothetical protein